jgi:hypothetical protein
MKRDLDLIRELLLQLEPRPVPETGIEWLASEACPVTGRSTAEIGYHLSLLEQAGFVDAGGPDVGIRQGVSGIAFRGLSWAGHDFLESVRNPDVWNKTRKVTTAVGGMTVQLLADLAKGFIKRQIEDHTGVKL